MKKYLLFALLALVTLITRAQTPLLWGVSSAGGTNNEGTIFNCSFTGDLTDIYNFNVGTDAQEPRGTLVQAANGVLYGLSSMGGINGLGTIFSYTISSSTENVVFNFSGLDGSYPTGSLLQASNGLLYGMTPSGGGLYDGVIFSYNIVTATCTLAHQFGITGDGIAPRQALIQATNGLLYGVTGGGGANSNGTIFSFNDTTNFEIPVYSFTKTGNAGYGPEGQLIQTTNGLLYGFNHLGGAYGLGTIFSYNIATGVETDVYNFGANSNDGEGLSGSLIQGNNGLLYGMTTSGGTNGDGTIFSFNDTTNIETILYDFAGGYDGQTPNGALLQASNGLFYGLTSVGGHANYGTVFNFDDMADTESVLHYFGYFNGANSYGSLIEVDTFPITTGTSQLSVNNNQLSIYPNPSTGLVTISSNQSPINQITVTDLLGRISYQSLPNQSKVIIDIKDEGMYFVTVTSGNETTTQKVLVIK